MMTRTLCRERERERDAEGCPRLHHTQGFTYPIMQVEELKDVVRRRAPRDPPVVLAGFSAGLGLSTSGMQQTYARSRRPEAHTAQIHGNKRAEPRTDLRGGEDKKEGKQKERKSDAQDPRCLPGEDGGTGAARGGL